MKNKYRKLKLSILLQAVFVTTLTAFVGNIIMVYVLEDSSNELVRMLTTIHIPEEKARGWYWRIIGDNKEFFLLIGFLILFSIFFYIALSKLERYLRDVEKGINNIASDSKESIDMIEELEPIETRLREIKSTLKKREREAERAEQNKNDMVVYLAHDLKTPLTSVVAYLTMLDNYKDMPDNERERYIRIALDKSIRLGELINEFFDITKLNLQNMKLQKEELHLSMMLEQVADEFYGVLQERGLWCELDIEDGLVVHGDADKLARVFDNILKNAASYCYANTPIRIRARRKEDKVEIVFSNQCKQIPKEKLDLIFERFYRLDAARQSETGGSGLGLAIAKQIVELHRGEIGARSGEHETCFIVELPGEENKGGNKWKS